MTKKLFLFFAAALVVFVGATSASTITQTKTFSGIPSMSGILNFNKFNPASGTLTSVQFTLNLNTSGGTLILDNDSALPASGNFEFGANGSISTSDVPLFTNSFGPVPGTVTAYHNGSFNLTANTGDGPGDYDPTPPDGMQYIGVAETGSANGFIGSNYVANYSGTGTYNINYSITQWLTYGGFGGIEYAVSPVSANGDVTVVYNYNAVPEPATITLLCTGALAMLRRKSSK
jgi:hypothetical protein